MDNSHVFRVDFSILSDGRYLNKCSVTNDAHRICGYNTEKSKMNFNRLIEVFLMLIG